LGFAGLLCFLLACQTLSSNNSLTERNAGGIGRRLPVDIYFETALLQQAGGLLQQEQVLPDLTTQGYFRQILAEAQF
jgi:hypothetical protein